MRGILRCVGKEGQPAVFARYGARRNKKGMILLQKEIETHGYI